MAGARTRRQRRIRSRRLRRLHGIAPAPCPRCQTWPSPAFTPQFDAQTAALHHPTRVDSGHHVGGLSVFAAWTAMHSPLPAAPSTWHRPRPHPHPAMTGQLAGFETDRHCIAFSQGRSRWLCWVVFGGPATRRLAAAAGITNRDCSCRPWRGGVGILNGDCSCRPWRGCAVVVTCGRARPPSRCRPPPAPVIKHVLSVNLAVDVCNTCG